MDISYFREFAVLAKTQNYWAAAEQLFIGQPSLSKHIKTLENQLGGLLFDRTSRKVELTEFGKMMLPYAQSIAKLQYEYEAAAAYYLQSNSKEMLHITSIPAIAQYNITTLLARFQSDYPNVQIDLQEADTNRIIDLLLERRCELAFYRDSEFYREHDLNRESQIIKIPYLHDHLVAVLPRSHPLAGESEVALSQLANEHFALIKTNSMPYNLCIWACREAGFVPQVLFSSHKVDTILEMVSQRACVALLFADLVKAAQHGSDESPFVALPITPAIDTTIYLAYRRNDKLSPAAAHFVEHYQLAHKLDLSQTGDSQKYKTRKTN